MNKIQDSDQVVVADKRSEKKYRESLLARIKERSERPCFILAPEKCGQQYLLQSYLALFDCAVVLECYEVTKAGVCIQREDTFELSLEGSCAEDEQDSTSNLAEAHCFEQPCVVMVAVPWLPDQAAQRLSDQLNAFVEEGKLVFVLCPIHNDRYQNLQSDREEITLCDLTLSGCFSSVDYAESLVHFLSEYLPLELRLGAVVTAVLGSTSVEELHELGFDMPEDLPELLPTLHPLFSAHQSNKTVQSRPLALEPLHIPLLKLLREYLEYKEQAASALAIASKITLLSITLLQRGNLEASHCLLALAEETIKNNDNYESYLSAQNHLSHMRQGKGLMLTSQQAFVKDASEEEAGHAGQTGLNRADHTSRRSEASPLYIRLFGTLEVYRGDTLLKNNYLSRTKVRRLLIYLAFNQHRLVSRDNLLSYLWPYLDIERAQKNLYTSWCMLAKGLGSDKVRECPYIQRNGEIYQLNSDLVSCDIHYFEDTSRRVLFDQCTLSQQEQNLNILESLYRDSLAADLAADEYISAKMTACRSTMVDALLLITRQLRDAGELEKALYYARVTYELDESREDVYRELMDTQYLAGQRTSAMQTYFSCKRYLSDELGILPSKSTTALYQDVLLDSCR